MLGQEGLLPPGMKSPNTPLHSPTRGQLFLSDHHSDNSNDPAVTSDQGDEDDSIRADPRIDLIDHRGDPRNELRAVEEAEDRAPGSPIGPLSLTTNDKVNSKASPKSSAEVSQDRETSSGLLLAVRRGKHVEGASGFQNIHPYCRYRWYWPNVDQRLRNTNWGVDNEVLKQNLTIAAG
jgi:hypothetical protein